MTDKFFIDLNISPENISFNYQSSIVTLGSCFSDEIGNKLTLSGFDVQVNPFGTLFHPFSIANVIHFTLGDRNFNLAKKGDVFLDYSFSGKLYAMSEEELRTRLITMGDVLKNQLKQATHLILTFGTSIGYELPNQLFVANCHQQPASNFVKIISSIEEMRQQVTSAIDRIKILNPNLQVIVTVSPVRHLKEGLVNNNRSKARLIQLCECLENDKAITYFPAYEIFMDVLRDYRFSKIDKSHPSEEAVEYIWDKFKKTYFTEEVSAISTQAEAYHRLLNHEFMYPESKEATLVLQKITVDRENLLSRTPNLRLKNLPH